MEFDDNDVDEYQDEYQDPEEELPEFKVGYKDLEQLNIDDYQYADRERVATTPEEKFRVRAEDVVRQMGLHSSAKRILPQDLSHIDVDNMNPIAYVLAWEIVSRGLNPENFNTFLRETALRKLSLDGVTAADILRYARWIKNNLN